MRAFLGAGAIVMVIAVFQTYVNHDLLLNKGNTSRVASTLGNSIYLSGYGLFLMFLGYILAMKENIKKKNMWFWYPVVGGGLGFWGIFLGGTRGAFLGLVIGVGVLLISYILALKGHKRLKMCMSALLILGVCIMGTFYAFRQTDFVKNIPAVGRLVNTEVSSTDTRVMAWGIAIEAWKEKPVFGWGPNNYYYAFNKYYRPEFLLHGWGETWFDNAHSVVMNTLAVQGFFGIVTYLVLYMLFIVSLWRAYIRNVIDIHVLSVGSAFLIAHLVSVSTVFENPTSYLYFFFFLAFLNVQMQAKKTHAGDEHKAKSKDVSTGGTISIIAVVILLVYSTNINPARANMQVLSLIKTINIDPQTAIATYPSVAAIPTPHIDDIRNDTVRILSGILRDPAAATQPWIAELSTLAIEEMKKNMVLHPFDIRVHITLAELYAYEAQRTNNPEYIGAAIDTMKEALRISPERQQVEYSLASYLHMGGKTDEAIEILQASVDRFETIGDGWRRLVFLYMQQNNVDTAVDIATEALSRENILLDEETKGMFIELVETHNREQADVQN